MAKVTLNTTALKAKLVQRFQDANEELEQIFDDQFDETKWSWPRATRRKNGQVVTSPRDIVDTGKLKNSRSLSFTEDGTVAVHRWSAEHANIVRLGGRSRTGKVIPPRDWVQEGIQVAKDRELFR